METINDVKSRKINIPELLAPAGNMECLKAAFIYGADAVYLSLKRLELRAFADNFHIDELRLAVEFAHTQKKKVYVAMNIFAHNEDIEEFEKTISVLNEINIDAVIVSDPGLLSFLFHFKPKFDIHLSTQANTTNWRSATFWHEQGVKRVILARELSLEEIVTLRDKTPKSLELECFVHGSMCVAYSGRCVLSNYLSGRDANRGQCSQPCRWKYFLTEEKRPGEYLPIMDDDRGSYIFNSKDLCMIEHIDKLINAGIDSFKVEGRMKGVYYVASVMRTYRFELDSLLLNHSSYKVSDSSIAELSKVSHRGYTTGFFFGKPDKDAHIYGDSNYIRTYDFIGIVLGYKTEEKLLVVEQRNNFGIGAVVELLSPGNNSFLEFVVEEMFDENMNAITVAPHAQQKVYVRFDLEVPLFSLMRKKVNSSTNITNI